MGRALALRMARHGWSVVASARREGELRTLAAEADGLAGSIIPLAVDVTDEQAVLRAVDQIEADIGPIALAVLNAGTHQPLSPADFSTMVFRDLWTLNVMGPIHALAALLPRMRARKSGKVALVSSLAGYAGLPTSAAYGATKAALINMAEALRPELEREGVAIQIVTPGFVRTPLTDRNPFPMPFLMEVEDAAEAFYRGLCSGRFEVTFPKRFAWLMRLLNILPYPLFFAVTRRLVPDR